MSPLNLPNELKEKLHKKLFDWFEIHKESDLLMVHENTNPKID